MRFPVFWPSKDPLKYENNAPKTAFGAKSVGRFSEQEHAYDIKNNIKTRARLRMSKIICTFAR